MYGLIGYPLTHSFSPKYFEDKFLREGIQDTYSLFPLKNIEDIVSLFQNQFDLRGLNVTIPHKASIISFLDELSEDAQKIGAVNCIKIFKGKKIGYNTDWLGFRDTLQPLLKPWHNHALILGSGGAAQAVRFALNFLGIKNLTVSRNPKLSQVGYHDLNEDMVHQHLLLINTTPLGMYPHTDSIPDFPTQFLTKNHIVYDLIYNPEITLLMKEAMLQGASVKNGYDMLVMQAELSWKIWNT